MKIKKIMTSILVFTFILTSSLSSFANVPSVVSSNNIQSMITEDSITLTASDMKANVYSALKKGEISQEHAQDLISIIDKHSGQPSSALSSMADSPSATYKNDKTGAVITYTTLPSPLHGMITMNKAGWDIIKEIVNIGGGASTVGGSIAVLVGSTIAGPIVAMLGGAVVVAGASVRLQFALGADVAVVSF